MSIIEIRLRDRETERKKRKSEKTGSTEEKKDAFRVRKNELVINM